LKKLTLKDQKCFYYVLSAKNEPTLTIEPGETVIVETEDAFSGQIRKPGDRRNLETAPEGNPESGPIYIEGAEKGDTLVVDIIDIKPTIGQGATRIPSWWWYLGTPGSEALEKFLNVKLPHGTRICPIKDNKVYFSEKIVIPYEPFIGTIGTALEFDATLDPGPNGGNMDQPEVKPGNRLYLPVFVEGALLHVGDVHATQGDGELCGVAIEMPAETTMKIDLIKGKRIRWPRVESPEHIMVITSSGIGRSLEDATRIGFIELILWMEEEYGFTRWDAYSLCTQVAKTQLGNFWTMAVKMPKKYLS